MKQKVISGVLVLVGLTFLGFQQLGRQKPGGVVASWAKVIL
jgi:hypothetical protein